MDDFPEYVHQISGDILFLSLRAQHIENTAKALPVMLLLIKKQHNVLHHNQGGCPDLWIEVVTLAFAELQVLFSILVKYLNWPSDMVNLQQLVKYQVQVIGDKDFPLASRSQPYKEQIDPALIIRITLWALLISTSDLRSYPGLSLERSFLNCFLR